MGTNFYLVKNKTTKIIMEEEFKLLLLEKLNSILPRERHRFLIEYFDLYNKRKLKELERDYKYEAFQPYVKMLEESRELYDKYENSLIDFSRKEKVTIKDLETVSELVSKKIDSFTEGLGYHIGKRSAAGYYCKKCNITLCDGGFDGIHSSDTGFYHQCPICHSNNDVEHVCSFTWQWSEKLWHRIFDKISGKLIVDEYGDEYSVEYFIGEELKAVPFNMFAEEKKHVFC